jgi:hypothetical protein
MAGWETSSICDKFKAPGRVAKTAQTMSVNAQSTQVCRDMPLKTVSN